MSRIVVQNRPYSIVIWSVFSKGLWAGNATPAIISPTFVLNKLFNERATTLQPTVGSSYHLAKPLLALSFYLYTVLALLSFFCNFQIDSSGHPGVR